MTRLTNGWKVVRLDSNKSYKRAMLSEPVNIQALTTVHNRCGMTLKCIRTLLKARPDFVRLKITVVDDGSTDETAKRLQEEFPDIEIVSGNGQLFWAGGMRFGFERLSATDYDFLLVFNDDTVFYENVFEILLGTAGPLGNSIAVGRICSCKQKTKLIYGPVRRFSWHPLRFRGIEIHDSNQIIDTFNMNAVLIPVSVIRKIGFIAREFTHSKGDFEFGLRAKKQNISVEATAVYVGCSELNPQKSMDSYIGDNLKKTLHILNEPKNHPFNERFYYFRLHGGPLWFILLLAPYIKFLVLFVLKKFWRSIH